MDTEIKNVRRRFEWKFGKAVDLRSSGLQKVSSSLQEVRNLPTQVYFLSKCCFGLGWALRAFWIVFPNTKIVLLIWSCFCSIDFRAEFGMGFVPCLWLNYGLN